MTETRAPYHVEHGEAHAIAATQQFLDRGEPLLAFNEAQAGLERAPGIVRLRQLQALALARSGDVGRANALLAALRSEGHDDAETLGMLARTHKDLALRSRDAAGRARHLAEAFALYFKAYENARARGADGDAQYTGINAATMAVLAGNLEKARVLAGEVRTVCERGSAGDSPSARYWRAATLAEALLIQGDAAGAAAHYANAARLAGRRFGDLASTRKQARLLATRLPGIDPNLTAALAIPHVLVFTGHMVDARERPSPRFPAAMEATVREAMRSALAANPPVAAYGSAACGADILCLELVRELGGETHVVLPFPPADFLATSVAFAGGDWAERFERALAAANSVTVTSAHRASGSAAAYEYANLVLTGMGRLRAQVLETDLRGLAVWDERAAPTPGGAASVVSLWRERGVPIDAVAIDAGPMRAGADADAADARPATGAAHEMRAMLFADAVGYSKLDEDQIPRYIEQFLGAIAQLSRRSAHKFEHVEVAGDGLYMVFPTVADAARYALELSALVDSRDWSAQGLPANLNLRVALHCGPVHCGTDPITGGPIYTGPHTSRAARIEPITPPGQVYASGAFAAVAAAQGIGGLAFGYVGRMPLAKGYGTLDLYHLE